MALKIQKDMLLPKADNIKDPETRRVIKEMLNIIKKMNQTNYGDLSGHEERITTLE